MRRNLRDLLMRLAPAADAAAAESFDHGHQKQGLWFRDAAEAAREAIEAIEQELPDSELEEALAMRADLGEPLDRRSW